MTLTWPRRRLARLQLEPLEDRSVPSTFTVNTTIDDVTPANGKFSLREAITKADITAGADVIVIPAGVYKITRTGAGENANATGDFDVTGIVTIQGAGAGLTIIDGQRLDRVFDITGTDPSAIKVVLQGLTVRNGSVTSDGGGIQVANADLVVRDCAVTGNRSTATGGGISNAAQTGTGNVKLVLSTVARNVAGAGGGGLFVGGSSLLTVTDSTIRRNIASKGGGINATTPTLTNCTISGNTAAGDSGGGVSATVATLTKCTVSGNSTENSGGGIQAGTASLTNSTISGNSAGFGGGIRAGTATLTNCTVSGNHTNNDGGGILTTATATLTKCTVSGNSASARGGGINAFTATLTNSTISGNSAVIEGGGIFATAATLLNCTVVENIAQTGGGLFHVAGGTFSVRNTIVALNLVAFGGNGPDAFGATFTSQGHNLIGDGTGSNGFTNGASGDIVGTNANPIDPKLGPLQNNGGPTQTMALKAGSLAIDAGDNGILPPTDQRGLPRKKDGNGDSIATVDIGAFER